MFFTYQEAITNFCDIFVLIINVLIEWITNFLMHENLVFPLSVLEILCIFAATT